jgi:DNA-binding NarL/FixJ family response regulator
MSLTTWQPQFPQYLDVQSAFIAAHDRVAEEPAGAEPSRTAPWGTEPSGEGPSGEEISLAAIWEQLISGRSKVVTTFCTEKRCYAMLANSEDEPPVRLTERSIACLERYLLGVQPKVVADELRLSRSTVTTDLGACLGAMGIHRQTSRIPVILAMAVRASRGDKSVPKGRLSELDYLGKKHAIISVQRPDLTLSGLLSPAEFSVARMLLEGRTHAEIAQLRRTSTRTIANQLAATFQKLGVSGRWQLLCYALRASGRLDYSA